MATRVAAAGGGNWTAGATWVGGVAPTAADDAQLTVASGNVTIDTGAVARSLDCTGYIGTLTHTASVQILLGDATAGAGNVALKLVAGMTYTLGNTSSNFAFISTSATQQTITTAGKTLGVTNINATGGSYILGDSLTLGSTSTLTLSAGTFNTGNFACSWGLFVLSGAGLKTLTLGSSAITITGLSAGYSGSGTTFTANTSVMTFNSSTSATFNGNGVNWNGLSLVFTNTTDAVLTGVNTVANITRTGPANKTATMTLAGNQTVTGTYTVNGNSVTNRMLLRSSIAGTARTVTTAVVSLSNTDFQDITAAGAAGTWTGTSMGNALGNANITFDAPTTQTRTAGIAGNWSDASRWTSRVPLPQDNVVIGAGVAGMTVEMPRLGANIDYTGFAGTAGHSTTPNTLYGSLTLGSGMTISGTQTLTWSGRSSHSITSNGRTWTVPVSVTAPSGTYTVQDAFTSDRDSSAAFNVAAGTLTVNNVNMTFTGANAAFATTTGAAVTVNMGTGTWSFGTTAAATFWNLAAATTLNASTSTIVLTAASASARTFAGAGQTYGTLTYTVAGSTGSLTLTGANTFGTVNFSDVTNARSLLFTAATTTAVTNFNVVGTAGKLMTIDSATAATHTLSKPTGTVSTDYVSVKNSLAGGGAYWYAGANSTDAGGNSGWKFSAPTGSDFLVVF